MVRLKPFDHHKRLTIGCIGHRYERVLSKRNTNSVSRSWWVIAVVSISVVTWLTYVVAINVAIMSATGWDSACELLGADHGLSENEYGVWQNEGTNIYRDPTLVCRYGVEAEDTFTLERSLASEQILATTIAGVGLIVYSIISLLVLKRANDPPAASAG